jgi:hypothetical protein
MAGDLTGICPMIPQGERDDDFTGRGMIDYFRHTFLSFLSLHQTYITKQPVIPRADAFLSMTSGIYVFFPPFFSFSLFLLVISSICMVLKSTQFKKHKKKNHDAAR